MVCPSDQSYKPPVRLVLTIDFEHQGPTTSCRLEPCSERTNLKGDELSRSQSSKTFILPADRLEVQGLGNQSCSLAT